MRHAITIFAVDDVARAAAFYEAAVGARRRVDVGVYVELDLPDGPGVGVYQRDGFAKNTGRPNAPCTAGSTTGTEIYFRVDDVDAAVSRALAAGAVMLSPAATRPWGETVAYVADPDGNVLAFARESGDE
jgi:lactoylglutathione lyase